MVLFINKLSPLRVKLKLGAHILARLVIGISTLIAISLVFFVLIEWAPGDFATIRSADLVHDIVPPRADLTAQLTAQTGLDAPAHVRYGSWLASMAQGDFGYSFGNQQPVSPLLLKRFVNTLHLAFLTLCLVLPLGIGLAIYCAIHRRSLIDRITCTVATLCYSIPEFLLGYGIVSLLAVSLGWFPSLALAPSDANILTQLYFLALPVLTLTIIASITLFIPCRALIIAESNKEHVQMAHLKGIRPWRITIFHILPGCLGPLFNIIVMTFANLIGGVIITEIVFVYPGLGQLLVDAVLHQDLPVVLACSVVISSCYVLLVMVADLITIISNPKISDATGG